MYNRSSLPATQFFVVAHLTKNMIVVDGHVMLKDETGAIRYQLA